MKLLLVFLALSSLVIGQDVKQPSEIDQLKVTVKIQELQIKDLQIRLSNQMIVSTELHLANLRRENASLSSDHRDLMTYFNSYIVALVARNGLDPDKWTYDPDKKIFTQKPPSR